MRAAERKKREKNESRGKSAARGEKKLPLKAEKEKEIKKTEPVQEKKKTPRKKSGAPEKKKSQNTQNKQNKQNKQKFSPVSKDGKVRVIPLGGLGEIGKNMTVLETDEDMIVIDCGMGFPDDGMPGIDLVIPDTTYLEENIHKLRGIFLTHGH